MKKKRLIIIMPLFLIGTFIGIYLLNGCQKDVEPIELDSTENYLSEIDFSNSNKYCDLLSNAQETGKISAELQTVIDEFGVVANDQLKKYIGNINIESLIAEWSNQYSVTKDEISKIEAGDLNTLNSVNQRFLTVPDILKNKDILAFLTKVFSDPIFMQYLPTGLNITTFDSLVFSQKIIESKRSAISKLLSLVADNCDCCRGATIRYGNCTATADLMYATSIIAALTAYAGCAKLALALFVWCPPCSIATAAVCVAALAAVTYLIIRKFSTDLEVCRYNYDTEIANCHRGGSGK